MQESRTAKSLKNAEVSIIYYALNLILGFWSRKVFYDYLGSEVLGLDTTASSLLSFLNLAELGVGSSVAFFLYQPMFDKDELQVNEIVALQGWIYRRIACVIIVAAAILMCFFPLIFADIKLPSWYPYATFTVLLIGALLGYFFNYRQCVLNADQKGYKVTRVTNAANIFFRILLIVLLPVVPNPFIFYLATNLFGSLFGCLWLNHILKKEYPWLHHAALTGRQLLKKYPGVLKKTSQIFFHSIASFIVFRVGPIIMYAYTTLTAIAYYGNYTNIIDKATDMVGMAFSSSQAAVGNIIASHDLKHELEIFWELNDSRAFLSTSFLLCLAFITEPFISVWLSPNYLLGSDVLIIIVLNSWLFLNRSTVESYIAGYGMFQDIWAPMVEAAINFAAAIFLGRLYGIAGVLLGTTCSNLVIVYGWKPYFLFTRGLKIPIVKNYYIPISKRYLVMLIDVVGFSFLNYTFRPKTFSGFGDVFIYGVIESVIIISFMYVEFYIFFPGMKCFHQRILGVLKGKFK